MKRSLLIWIFVLPALGAGCGPQIIAPSTAEPLRRDIANQPIPEQQGFGIIPKIPTANGNVNLTFASTLPTLSGGISILRVHRGTPNITEMKNLATAIGLSGLLTGDQPSSHELTMDWTDEFGFHWKYLGSERQIEFEKIHATREPLTVATLPLNDELIQMADNFLLNHGVNPKNFRDGQLNPDWNLWWINQKSAGNCPDEESLVTIRAVGASVGLTVANPPTLPNATTTKCVQPEFPNRVTIKYWSFFDNKDVYDEHGEPIVAATIVVDALRHSVISGTFTLPNEIERSDYPALDSLAIRNTLKHGGISNVTGNITLTTYALGFYQHLTTENDARILYLIPALIAEGVRTESSAATERVRLVVPLVKQ